MLIIEGRKKDGGGGGSGTGSREVFVKSQLEVVKFGEQHTHHTIHYLLYTTTHGGIKSKEISNCSATCDVPGLIITVSPFIQCVFMRHLKAIAVFDAPIGMC